MKLSELQSCVTTPMITIVLPVFNGGNALSLSVESLLAQTFSDWELLIFDDGSTDRAVDRLRCLDDPRVRVINDGFNRGLAARLNQAIGVARGKFIARMDQDDICHPERLARQLAYLQAHREVDLLSTHCVIMNEQEHINGLFPSYSSHEDICRRPWQGLYMPHPTWMGHIEWFRRHQYREPGPYCCEDQELLLRASAQSRYYTLPERLLAYRVHTHIPWKKLWRTRSTLARIQSKHFLDQGNYVYAALSWAAWTARIVTDTWQRFLQRSPVAGRPLVSRTDLLTWDALIARLKASVEARE